MWWCAKMCRLVDAPFQAGAYAVVVTWQGWALLLCSAPRKKGRGMTTRRTLHLPALLGTLAAAVLVACAVALLAVSREADATFPGKNGRIAYETGGLISRSTRMGAERPKSPTPV